MANHNYYQAIIDMLQGESDQLRVIPPERLDWAGPGALLEMYRKTSGNDRNALIQAMGQVIQNHQAPPSVLAQLIQIASSLDLAEVEPHVRNLRAKVIAGHEPLQSAITNYLAFRDLNTTTTLTRSRAVKDKSSARKARSARGTNGKTGTG